MSLKRYAAKRDANEGEIVATLTAIGASVVQLSIKGAPDLLVGFRGNHLLEVKAPKGKLTEDQIDWHLKWNGDVVIVTTPEEALIAIGAISPPVDHSGEKG